MTLFDKIRFYFIFGRHPKVLTPKELSAGAITPLSQEAIKLLALLGLPTDWEEGYPDYIKNSVVNFSVFRQCEYHIRHKNKDIVIAWHKDYSQAVYDSIYYSKDFVMVVVSGGDVSVMFSREDDTEIISAVKGVLDYKSAERQGQRVLIAKEVFNKALPNENFIGRLG